MNIQWQDYITNKAVLEKAQMLPSCYYGSCTGQVMSLAWRTQGCPKQSSIVSCVKGSVPEVAPSSRVKATLRFDSIRHQTDQKSRGRRKGTVPAQSHTQVPTSHEFQCPSCHRTCSSRIGLFIHHRTCHKSKQIKTNFFP
ncbi:hypothetical protein AAFF_G00414590 [Aldrovandia affinis]|uniref:C2H2-type domain-containing protein n=1 Tax=Aldrovandia affinis TaxID=143900 RepID=A0AAD7SAQ5_9TELE|nr:hypothetical protein AAFF_G00414590 [Aldrovandia affinis]